MIVKDSSGNGFDLRSRSCPICGDSDTRVLGYRGGSHHRHGLGIETRIVQCRQCSLIYPNPFPYALDPQSLYSDPAQYFAAHNEDLKVENARRLVLEIARRLGRRQFTMIDVGSGRGELLQAAKLEGVAAVGLDFSSAMIEHTRRRYGIDVLHKSIEAFAGETAATFDIVVLGAVLEHVYDPDSMIRAAAQLVEPRGLLYLDVPNEPHLLSLLGNLWNRLWRRDSVLNLSPTWSPYHVFGFNPKALSTLLAKHGFSVTAVQIFAATEVPRMLLGATAFGPGSLARSTASRTGRAPQATCTSGRNGGP